MSRFIEKIAILAIIATVGGVFLDTVGVTAAQSLQVVTNALHIAAQ